MSVKVFADGADLPSMRALYGHPLVKGFTTNPTLMRKAGVADYRAFARQVLDAIPDRPISFEVFSDDFGEMERQAREIAGWSDHVYVKIPVTDTRGRAAYPVIGRLSRAGVKVNVTAVFTLDQVRCVTECLAEGSSSFISIFAGRIADTGVDPVPHMSAALEIVRPRSAIEVIWASPREVWNFFQADAIGCYVITMTPDLIAKLELSGRSLDQFSRETVQMFHDDARKAGYTL